ncbi:MAG: S1 RNA-binding domain-containing protein [Patescibacteria group bacterium]|nr:S1 RNA-binding domain-containing protein [Patescibacteria group bacterium]
MGRIKLIFRKLLSGLLWKLLFGPEVEMADILSGLISSGVEMVKISPEQIKKVIGRDGESINAVREKCGVQLFIKADGTIFIFSGDNGQGDIKLARKCVEILATGLKIGQVFKARVTQVYKQGAMVEIFPGIRGIIAASEMDSIFVRRIWKNEGVDFVCENIEEGYVVDVFVGSLDEQGRPGLSQKFPREPRPEDFVLALAASS